MSPSPPRPDSRHLRIADLEVDVARAIVRRGATELSLPRLSFDLLLALAEVAPAVATTDMLLQRVWPGLVVNPETVSQRVKLLRAALGDDPRQPRYLMVVRGRGYRLLPEVEWLPDESAAPRPAAPPPPPAAAAPPPGRASPRPGTRLAASLVVVTVLVLAIGLARREMLRPLPNADAPRAVAAAAERSIVVMPFETAVGDAEAAMLARGIEEAVTHQLGGLPETLVIARSSARAAAREGLDATALGRRLDVRYLLEGGVQRIAGRARVTATLVDARRGARIWSTQLDRPAQDVFAIQDEIGVSVARALQLRLQTLRAGGTPRFEAWLEYLRGRELLVSGAVADLPRAIERLSLALRIDPGFARAHVELARAELLAAEYGDPATRDAAFAAATDRARAHVARALELDPADGRAWLQRAYLASFSEPAAAEADFRKGLELSPSEAEGWEGLATLTYRDPSRSAETLAQIERARRLDPLDPRYDVIKAVFMLYRRGDAAAAERLLRAVLARAPRYVPALTRLGETLWCCSSDLVGGIRYLEQALAEDPQSEWTRRALIQAYASLGESATGVALAREIPAGDADVDPDGGAELRREVRRIPLLVASADWHAAGEVALRGFSEQTLLEIDSDVAAFAVRRHARALAPAALRPVVELLARQAGARWATDGSLTLEADTGLMSTRVALADLLQQAGEATRAAQLLDVVLRDMQQQSSRLGRGALWFAWSRPIALMLRGDGPAALAALEAGAAAGALHHHAQHYAWHDPVLQRLHAEPRFRRIVEGERLWLESQRSALREARAAGLVPPPRR